MNFQSDYQKSLLTTWRAGLRNETIQWVKKSVNPTNPDDPYATATEESSTGTLTGIVGWGTQTILSQVVQGGIVDQSDCSVILASGTGKAILEQGNTYFVIESKKLRVVNYTIVEETGEIIVSLNKIGE